MSAQAKIWFGQARNPRSAPPCQEGAENTFLGNVFSFLEELGRDDDVGVEDFDADDAVVLPIGGR